MPWMDWLVRRLARYSEGLRIVSVYGPLSGPVLEYVCTNQPQGRGRFGHLIDRLYLATPVNEHTRCRVASTRQLVAELLQRRPPASSPTVILDLASGTARYLRDLARQGAPSPPIIVCHDRSPRQVMLGRELVDKEGLPHFSFAVGDATDQASYLTRHDPDIVLAVELFPYLHDDADVTTVIRLAYQYLRPGGCLVCSTYVKPPPGAAYWSADAFGRRPLARPPETIKAWLVAAGFTDIDQRYSQPNGFALVGWKPDKA